MDDVITLSKLLSEATTLQSQVRQIQKPSETQKQTLTWEKFERRYRDWYQRAERLLPTDLGTSFSQILNRGAEGQPSLNVIFQAMRLIESGEIQGLADKLGPMTWWEARELVRELIGLQREQVFFARRRAWGDRSTVPAEVQSTLANVCKQIYQLPSIADVFIRAGCESHWPLPPFQPVPKSERVNEALSWLDGLAVYAPEREVAIVRRVCESILARPGLAETVRTTVQGLLVQLQQLEQPASSPASNPLDRYPVHPTVRRIAGPLMAGGHHTEALLRVCIALNQAVQVAVGRPDLDGSALMQQVFSPKAPLLRLGQTEAEQLGWMQLFTGLHQVVRNPRAHRPVDDSDEAATLEWLLFASALFRALDTAVAAVALQPPPASSP